MKKTGMSSNKRELRRDKMHQDIITASTRRFAQSGYWAASLRDIAEDMGITAASLYNHFESKEQILWEIIGGTLDRLQKLVIAEMSQDAPALTRFRNILKLHICFTIENATDTKIINEDGHFLSDRLFAAAQERQRTMLNVYRACIAELAASGYFKIPDATVCAFYALSAVNGASRRFKPGRKWSLEQVADSVAELILKSFRNQENSTV